MVRFRLLYKDKKRAQYIFYPENDYEDPGIIDFDLTKEPYSPGSFFVTPAKEHTWTAYAGHSISKIYEYNFPPYGNSAWY